MTSSVDHPPKTCAVPWSGGGQIISSCCGEILWRYMTTMRQCWFYGLWTIKLTTLLRVWNFCYLNSKMIVVYGLTNPLENTWLEHFKWSNTINLIRSGRTQRYRGGGLELINLNCQTEQVIREGHCNKWTERYTNTAVLSGGWKSSFCMRYQ